MKMSTVLASGTGVGLTTSTAAVMSVDSLTPIYQWALSGFAGAAPDGVARTLAALSIVAAHLLAKVVVAYLKSRGITIPADAAA